MTKEEVKKRIVEILDSYTKEMEGYSYYGSNPGVSHSDYEDIAEDIYKEFDIIG
jgi:hypothetical protein